MPATRNDADQTLLDVARSRTMPEGMTAWSSLATAEALTRIADLLEPLAPLGQFVPALVGVIVEELGQSSPARPADKADDTEPDDVNWPRFELDRLAELARAAGFLP